MAPLAPVTIAVLMPDEGDLASSDWLQDCFPPGLRDRRVDLLRTVNPAEPRQVVSRKALHTDGEARTMLLKMANEELKHKEKMEYLYSNTAFPQTSGG